MSIVTLLEMNREVKTMCPVVIGLTGQTGAGKTTVCDYARELSCDIISADAIAREVMKKGSPLLKKLEGLFGSDITDSDGLLNRRLLASRAFSSRENTDLLNSTVHPYIIGKAEEEIKALGKKGSRVIVFDASQLFESGGERLCDSVIAVTAPQRIRLERIMKRDGISEEAAMLRINAQYDEDYYTSRADYVIDGSRSREIIRRRMEEITEMIIADREKSARGD